MHDCGYVICMYAFFLGSIEAAALSYERRMASFSKVQVVCNEFLFYGSVERDLVLGQLQSAF